MLLVLTVLGATPAQAHAVLVGSDPVSGAVLAVAPDVVTLRFDEEISDRLSSARLVDGGGGVVGGTRSQVGPDERVLTLALPDVEPGSYGVLWQVLAQDDGHTSSGTLVFTVGAPTGAAGPVASSSSAPRASDVVLRWARIAGLAGLVGAFALLGVLAGGPSRVELAPPTRVAVRVGRRRMRRTAVVAAAFGVGVAVVDVVAQVARLRQPGSGWAATASGLLGGTRWGHLWLVRGALLVTVLVMLLVVRERATSVVARRAAVPVAAAATVGLVVVEAAGSHAAAVTGDPGVAVAVDAVHVLAACLWVGSVGALAVVLGSPVGRGGGAGLVRAFRGRFSRVVLVSVGVALASGLYGAGRQVRSVDDLATTAYGRALLVKVGVVAVTLGLGLVNSTRLHGRDLRRPGARRVAGAPRFTRRLVAVEVGAAAVLVVAVAVLVETAPDRGVAAPTAESAVVSGSVSDLVVTVTASPGRPGVNGFTVVVASSRRPPPAQVDGVRLDVTTLGRTSVALQEVGDGRYFGTGQVDAAGVVEVDAVVERAGAEVVVPLTWHVALPADDVTAAGRPLAPYVDGLALLLVAAGAAAGVLVARRQRTTSVSDTACESDPLVPVTRTL
ncbi:copper resistance CopC/CopD family protein [Cellulomonas chitinilytica]|uniref:copper resistance CopC/CopD family protein n=1 Tax=Cellulomonas chitinilytica TaxID=398759 RepID=UPI001940536B|nr:copper resistance protein CopC [Cellulomonas chitinilytica]